MTSDYENEIADHTIHKNKKMTSISVDELAALWKVAEAAEIYYNSESHWDRQQLCVALNDLYAITKG